MSAPTGSDANAVLSAVFDSSKGALRISGTGGSGAPTDASYVTMVSEAGLSNESVLGTAVIMAGTLGARPAAATAGRLYYASDNGIIYRDTGSAWVAITGASTGVVVLAPATSATNVIQSTADATELTLKAFAGQTAPVLDLKDENNNDAFKVTVAPESIDYYMSPNNDQGTDGEWWLYSDETIGQQYIAMPTNDIHGLHTTKIRFAQATGVGNPITPNPFGAMVAAAILEMSAEGLRNIQIGTSDVNTLAIIRAVVAQPLPLTQWQNASGNDVSRIMPNGQVISNAHVAPADADLNNSDFAFWLDDTPGTTILKVKAKDSAGTIRTASVPLS